MKHGTCVLCDKSPSYGFPNDNLRRYCATHRKEGMKNLTKRPCLKCEKTASFGYLKGGTCQFCSLHKQEGMIHTSDRYKHFKILQL